MGRPLRIKAPNLTYHITSRTNGRRILLNEEKDREALCKILRRILDKYGVILHSLNCLGNHFHMMIHIKGKTDLSQVICEFKTAYAKYYNQRHNCSGHFWGDRFRSTIVEDDKHALACLRYIDRNPVKAGLTDQPQNWPFSSFHIYASGQPHPILRIIPHAAYLGLSCHEETRRSMYVHFVLGNDPESDALHGCLPRLQFYGSDCFIRDVKNRIG